MIVLDASLAIAWLLNENGFSDLELSQRITTETLFVPAHWPLEVGNVLLTNVKKKRLSQEEVAELMRDLQLLDITVQSPILPARISDLVRFGEDHGLTSYDAAYVDLAIETKATLATLDKAMQRAATGLQVPLIPNIRA